MLEHDDVMLVPECHCDGGKMSVHCAGKTANHASRFYYKCLNKGKQNRAFLWCDDYHRDHPSHMVPKFLKGQSYKPTVRRPFVEECVGELNLARAAE